MSPLLLLLACQDPFAVDRHDLVGFRVAALEVEPDGDDHVVPRLAVVVDGRPYADEQPLLSWFWLDEVDQLAELSAVEDAVASGAAPRLERVEGRPVLGLLARHEDEEQRAFVVLDDTALADEAAGSRPTGIGVESVDLRVDSLSEETVALEERRALPTTGPSRQVDPAAALRLTAEGVSDDDTVRWMATAGTFLELDDARTDWLASDVYLDDGEIEERDDLAPGPVTFLALSVGDARARYAATDAYVGEAPPYTMVQGRLLPGLALDEPAWVTLRADDDAPSGLSILDPEPLPVGTDPDTLSVPSLPCFEPTEGPFDPGWLLSLHCARTQLDGERTLVVPDAWRTGR